MWTSTGPGPPVWMNARSGGPLVGCVHFGASHVPSVSAGSDVASSTMRVWKLDPLEAMWTSVLPLGVPDVRMNSRSGVPVVVDQRRRAHRLRLRGCEQFP